MNSLEMYEEKILSILLDNEKRLGYTIGEVSKKLNLNRNSTSKYLNIMKEKGTIDFEQMGPCMVWYVNPPEKVVISKIKKVNDYIDEIRNIIPDSVDISDELDEIQNYVSEIEKKFEKKQTK